MTSIQANYSIKNSNIATIVPDPTSGYALIDPRYTQTFIIDSTNSVINNRVTLDISPTIVSAYPAMRIVLLFKSLEGESAYPIFTDNFNVSTPDYVNRTAFVYNGNFPCLTLISDGSIFIADSFSPGDWHECFAADSQIVMADGSLRTIDTICVGDLLLDGIVTALMKFKVYPGTPLYNVDGITVSGSHIIYMDGKAMCVCDSGMPLSTATPDILYSLNTTTHKIHIQGINKRILFADWEEINEEDISDWDLIVRQRLRAPSSNVPCLSETGLFSTIQIMTKSGPKSICDIQMGDFIADLHGFTEVIGTIKLLGSEVDSFNEIGSGATWIFHNKQWTRSSDTDIFKDSDVAPEYLYSLFTTSGTFYVGSVLVRDFSELGLSYDTTKFVLDKLNYNVQGETCHLVKEQLPSEIPMLAQLCQ